MRNHVAIVTGVTSPIGKAYADALAIHPNTTVIGTCRTSVSEPQWNLRPRVDLLSRAQVEQMLDTIDFSCADDVTLMHTVGKFKFEDPPPLNGSIDPTVLATNLYTFENVVLGLIERISRETRLSLCMLGSVSDVYQVPFWKSFAKSKNLMRALISRVIADHTRRVIKGLSIDICSVGADPTAGLTVQELIEQSIPEIERTIQGTRSEFRRLNILRHAPEGFDWKRYYSDPDAIRARWKDRLAGD